MTHKITILEGHHGPAAGQLTRALADAYADGATAAGHVVRRVKLGLLEFPVPGLRGAAADAALIKMLEPARDAISASDHVMLILPTLFESHPSAVKAFFDQIGRFNGSSGIASRRAHAGLWAGRNVRIIASMGIAGAFYRIFHRELGLKAARRSLSDFLGIHSIRGTVLGLSGEDVPDRLQAWLCNMRRLGAEDVRLGVSRAAAPKPWLSTKASGQSSRAAG